MAEFRLNRTVPLLAVIDTGALVATTPALAQLPSRLHDPRAWVDRVGADRAALTVGQSALWLAGVWLAIALGAALLSCAPGVPGSCGRVVVGRVMPGAMRAAVLSSIGLSVVLTPAMAQAAGPVAHHGGASVGATVTASAPTGAQPSAATSGDAVDTQVAARVDWPRSAAPDGARAPAPGVPWPSSPYGPHGQDPGVVTVHPGDSLWAIVARRIGPHATPAQIAHAWPGWYHANRQVIGDDPNRLSPGQHLGAPTAPSSLRPDEKGTAR